jgi:uncharacterized protein YndB with AHSA1/START domain
MAVTTDVIEKSIVIESPLERVFRAISEPTEFGSWFSEGVEGGFEVGDQPVIDEGKYGKFRLAIVGRTFPTYFAYRWVSGSAFIPQGFVGNPLEAPNTLVEFFLSEVPEGTKVTVRETGFASLPVEYRDQVVIDNTAGWEHQMGALARYISA